MSQKLVLDLMLLLCLLLLTNVSLINLDKLEENIFQESSPLRGTSAYSHGGRIQVEGADATWEVSTQYSKELAGAAKEVPARILAEYADSVLNQELAEPQGLSQVASNTSPRVLVEYANSIFSQELVKPEQLSRQVAGVSPRILVEYADSILSLDLEAPVPLAPPIPTPMPTLVPTPTPARAPTPTLMPTLTPTPTPTPTPVLKPGEPYVDLYGHKTDVTVGEEVILYLSAVNPITSPGTLMIQLTLRIPSGWSITSSGFGHGPGGLRTNTYEIKQGPNPQAIDVHILANQPFEGEIIGYMDYYFVEKPELKGHKEIRLSVSAQAVQPSPKPSPFPKLTPTPAPSKGFGCSRPVEGTASPTIFESSSGWVIGGLFWGTIYYLLNKRRRRAG